MRYLFFTLLLILTSGLMAQQYDKDYTAIDSLMREGKYRSALDAAGRVFQRAEQAALAMALSRTVRLEAIARAGRWSGALANVALSVNLRPDELAQDGTADDILAALDDHGLPPGRLTVELVENGAIESHPEIGARLQRLRDAGCRIAIDDFGTGYSCLAYLTNLPIDTLKIDRGLVADIVGGDRDRIVVRAMLKMAQELGLRTVVEGVENVAQLDLLAEWGADLYQGFLGSGPLDEQALSRFVACTNRD